MSSVLMVESQFLECSPRLKDNKFVLAGHVSENQSHQDNILANALQNDISERLQKELNMQVVSVAIKHERRSTRVHFEGKYECQYIAHSMTIHNFTNEVGEIKRRLIVLYPMIKGRQGEIPRDQVIHKLMKKAREEDSKIEVLNLRHYEDEKKCLEGQGAMLFSQDGLFVYMSQSARTNDEVFDVVCSRENLDIPESRRFVFTTEFPHNEKSADVDPLYHTSLIGWCGKGICAFGFEFMKFSSEAKQERFYRHIELNYKKIINLNAREIRAFAGGACEISSDIGNGKVRRVLCISDTAIKSLQVRNKKILDEWYGPENIFVFYGEVVQRRSGACIRDLICNSITHGPVPPSHKERSTLSMAKVDVFEDDGRL